MAVETWGMVGVFLQFVFLTGIGVPLGVPPAPEDPLMARVASEKCLYYGAWAGMAEPRADATNHAEQLLAEPQVRQLVAELDSKLTNVFTQMAKESGDPKAELLAAALPQILKKVFTNPGAVCVSDLKITPREGGGDPKIEIEGALVVKINDDIASVKKMLEAIQEAYLPPEAVTQVEHSAGKETTTFHQFRLDPEAPLITWGVKRKTLIVGLGDKAIPNLFASVAQGVPKWLADIRQENKIPRLSTITHVDVGALLKVIEAAAEPRDREEMTRVLGALGLNDLTFASSVTGLDEEGFVQKTDVQWNGAGRGLLGLAGAAPLTAADLAGVRPDCLAAGAMRLDGAAVFDAVVAIASEIEPNNARQIQEALDGVKENIGVDVRADLLAALGDAWTLHADPDEGGVFTGWTLTANVRDRAKLLATQEKLLDFARVAWEGAGDAPRVRSFDHDGVPVFYLEVPEPSFVASPAWAVTADRVVFGLNPQVVKSYLAARAEEPSLADLPEVASLLAKDQSPLAVWRFDTRQVLSAMYPMAQMMLAAMAAEVRNQGVDFDANLLPSLNILNKHALPATGSLRRTAKGLESTSRQSLPGNSVGAASPMLIALLLPAVQSARSAARRMQGSNNLKQIGLALHNHHDAYRGLPAAYNTDKDGKPLLSWRVHILPFVEQQTLYDQFKFDEPWDSEHNKKLIANIPEVYRSPQSRLSKDEGKTNYLAIRGKGAVMAPPTDEQKGEEHPRGATFAAVTDGTSNTIVTVEVPDESAVIWTKPDDFEWDEELPTKGLLGLFPGGFQAGFMDGSVRFINQTIDVNVLKNLFQKDDGNAIGDF